jgi:hypothetical protein
MVLRLHSWRIRTHREFHLEDGTSKEQAILQKPFRSLHLMLDEALQVGLRYVPNGEKSPTYRLD